MFFVIKKKPAEVLEENVENNVAALTKLEGDNKDLLVRQKLILITQKVAPSIKKPDR